MNWDLFASAEVELCRTCNSRARVQSEYDKYKYKHIESRWIYQSLNYAWKIDIVNIILQKMNGWEVERRPVAKGCHEFMSDWIRNRAGEDFLGTVNQTVEETLGPPEKAPWALWISGRFYMDL